jgi:acyl carrier protein
MPYNLDELSAQVAAMLNQEYVETDAGLATLGVDSLNVVELILICQELYPNAANFDTMEMDEYSTLRDIDEFLGSSEI